MPDINDPNNEVRDWTLPDDTTITQYEQTAAGEYWGPDYINTIVDNGDGTATVTSTPNTNNQTYNTAPDTTVEAPVDKTPPLPPAAVLDVTVVDGVRLVDGEERSTSFAYGKYFENRSTGAAWQDLEGAGAVDGQYAISVVGPSGGTKQLFAQNFTFSLPKNAIIAGIEVEVDRRVVTGSITDETVEAIYCSWYVPPPPAAYSIMFGFSLGSGWDHGTIIKADQSGPSPLTYTDVKSGTYLHDSGATSFNAQYSTLKPIQNGPAGYMFAHTYHYNTTTYPQTGIYRSTDGGATWAKTSASFQSVTVDNLGTYCAYNGSSLYMMAYPSSDKVAISSDFVTWTLVTCPDTGGCLGLHYTNGRWYFIGATYVYYSTNDGTSWTACTVTGYTIPDLYRHGEVHSNGDLYIAGVYGFSGVSKAIWKCNSGDPTNFVGSYTFSSAISNVYGLISEAGNLYCYVYNSTLAEYQCYISTDNGGSWTGYSLSGISFVPTSEFFSIRTAHANGKIYISGGGVWVSSDGYTFTQIVTATATEIDRGLYPYLGA